ncbi:MAG: helix-turn-helix domain-containing protein [Bacteroidetes bacterium]|nr:helix-turn-helix domain-containing protein [Bacteroidota bacterium]MCY4232350.1 helix-turn-helix domain-containing protein [Bacteroidota bacterium]
MKPFDKKYVKRFMTMRDLTKLTGYTARQVRYLIAEGFVPPPTGGRANAEYGETHISAIKRYQDLRAAGFSPASIRVLYETHSGVPIEIVQGVSLIINPNLIPDHVSVDELQKHIRSAVTHIFSQQNQSHSDDKS